MADTGFAPPFSGFDRDALTVIVHG
jgi:hypothetical protein